MNVEVFAGNILDVPADVLISTANPWLQMTGGVNLAIIVRPKGDDVFVELQTYLRSTGKEMVEPGTVVCTGPGSLQVKKILHAVSIDPSYDSSIELVAKTIVTALTQAQQLDARVVTLAALATGFGPLLMEDFALALRPALVHDWSPIETIKVVVKHEEEAAQIRAVLGLSPSAATRP
jgi:O-acetyl-ADP-ribose deacetylase (regulator of RNase III)